MNNPALATALDRVHLLALVAVAALVWLVPDGPIVWRGWVVSMLAVACAAALGARGARGLGTDGLRLPPWPPLLTYAAYACAWLASYWAHPSSAGVDALMEQGAMLALIGSVAALRRAASIAALVVILLALVCLQVLGPASVIDHIGRAVHFQGARQWGGYPELGMLASLGAAACLAVLFAARRVPLAVAAGVLAAGFTGAAAYMVSRSAVLTIAGVAPWLALVAVVRMRTRIAIVALVAMAIGGVIVAARMDPGQWTKLAAATHVSGLELDQRSDGWHAAAAMLHDYPWLGVGPAQYRVVYDKYSTRKDPTHAYNLFLHTGAELGAIGLAAFALVWARVLIRTVRLAGSTGAGLAAFATHGMLLAFVIRSQSEHFLANLPTSFRMLLVLGFLFGLAEAANRASADSRRLG